MWQEKNGELYQKFEFKDFQDAFLFMQVVATEAEKQHHHPRWCNDWNVVEIWLSTHEAGHEVTDKDWSLAEKITELFDGQQMSADDSVIKYEKIKLYADGGSRGNPGPSASGYVLMDLNDNVIFRTGIYLGVTTNNQAEYKALKFGLEKAQKMLVQEVNVFLDSLLVVNQMKGTFKIKNKDLLPIYDAIQELLGHFRKVTFTHVPRALNKLADAEVNKVLDL
ncbi:reverse transcriptase-like protein [Candidatus Saccharibacteria bacterium]|nr:reverse transcriptase-like protein [Candidatus Saccharibacteria bacterium]MBI3337766.1 reverse transcriptase-like protein [Candidatus Saccharibacteria bacterium]